MTHGLLQYCLLSSYLLVFIRLDVSLLLGHLGLDPLYLLFHVIHGPHLHVLGHLRRHVSGV